MKKSVFFNLDGTLTSNVPYQEITENILVENGVSDEKIDPWKYYELFFENFENLDENPYNSAFREYVKEFDLGLDPNLLGSEYKRRELAHVEPAEGLYKVLEDLEQKYEMGIITDGISSLQEKKIEKIAVKDFFSTILISYRDGGNKEDLEIFTRAEIEHEDSGQYLYISHKDKDIASADAAGWKTAQKRIPELRNYPITF